MNTKIRIIRATNAFAYLPLYLAEHYDLFNEPECRDAGSSAETEYEFSSEKAAPIETIGADASAIEEMVTAANGNQLAYALADPLEIYNIRNAKPNELIVLGAFLKRPPFWVVNSKPAETIADLNLDHLIFYHRDALQTGNYIGRYIADTKNIRHRDSSVMEFGQELELLVQQKEAGHNSCGALTADLLGMARFSNRSGPQQCTPILRVFKQKDFQHFVNSAFITHKSVVQENTEAARILIRSIRLAMSMLQTPHVVAQYCQLFSSDARFRQQIHPNSTGVRSPSLTSKESKWVARRIIHDELYSSDLTISLDDWMGASKADRFVVTPDGMESLYNDVVEPGNNIARESTIPGRPRPGRRKRWNV